MIHPEQRETIPRKLWPVNTSATLLPAWRSHRTFYVLTLSKLEIPLSLQKIWVYFEGDIESTIQIRNLSLYITAVFDYNENISCLTPQLSISWFQTMALKFHQGTEPILTLRKSVLGHQYNNYHRDGYMMQSDPLSYKETGRDGCWKYWI